jgi:WD40 repeat protein
VIASANDDCTIKLCNVQKREEIETLKGHKKAVTSVSSSPDNRMIVSSSKDKTIRFWEKNE